MNTYRKIIYKNVFCLKRITRNILLSDYCVSNKFYSNFIKKRALSRIVENEQRNYNNLIIPATIEIELTNNCNLNCVFCPNSTHKRKRGITSFGVFKKIIDDIKNIKDCLIVISGFGESLLDNNILQKLNYLYDHNISWGVELVTNGCLLNETICNALCSKKLVDKIDISIDAGNAEIYKSIHSKDAFDVIFNNIKHLCQARKSIRKKYPFISVRFKGFHLNRGDFRRFVDKFSPWADEIKSYINIFEWPFSDADTKAVRKDKNIKVPCPNLWEGCRINWNGDIVLCCMDYEGEVVLGNIAEKGLLDIWNGPLMMSYRNKHKSYQFDDLKICKICEINSHIIIPW